MMSTDLNPKTDKELWLSLATGPIASTAASDMDLAEWLEGRLSETAAARIEAQVSANPEMRMAALELADILGKPLPAPPDRMAIRAKALIGFKTERQAPGRGWLQSLLGSFALPRAAMASAAVVLAITGFMMGGGLGESYAHEKVAKSYSVVTVGQRSNQSGNEMTSYFSADGI
jgi:hypothetical protein